MSKAALWMKRMSRKRKRNDLELTASSTAENLNAKSEDDTFQDRARGQGDAIDNSNAENCIRPLFKDEIMHLSLDELVFLRAVSKDNAKLIPETVAKWLFRRIVNSTHMQLPDPASMFERFNTCIDGECKLLQLWLMRPNFKKSVDHATSILVNEYAPILSLCGNASVHVDANSNAKANAMQTSTNANDGTDSATLTTVYGRLDYKKALSELLNLLKPPAPKQPTDDGLPENCDDLLVKWLDDRDAIVQSRECGVPRTSEYAKLFANVPVDVCRALANQKQGTDTWLRSRKWLLTGSAVAAVVDHNPYNSWHETVLKILKSEKETHDAKTLSNFKYGHDNEPHARAYLESWFRARPEKYIDFEMFELGMVLGQWCDEVYGFAYSPDGIVRYTDSGTRETVWALIEYKCPALAKRPYPRMPAYYFDQVQMGMGLFGMSHCFFVAWSPLNGVSVQVIPFVADYFEDVLLLRARNRIRSVLCAHEDPPIEARDAVHSAVEMQSINQSSFVLVTPTPKFAEPADELGALKHSACNSNVPEHENVTINNNAHDREESACNSANDDDDVTDDNEIIDEFFYDNAECNEDVLSDASEKNCDYECEYE